ncbi:nucleotide pyrophosphohydrolase [Candidatus Micrarchaeota archaeon]|nr:nucleotide pyrophosphohydrolase [Candidatus Micrarchaeota archaeon]
MKLIQEKVDNWINTNGGYWPEHIIFMRLVEEVGEIGRVLSLKTGHRKKAEVEKIDLEIGDVMFSLAALANLNNIDIEKAIEQSIDKYNRRSSNSSEENSFHEVHSPT